MIVIIIGTQNGLRQIPCPGPVPYYPELQVLTRTHSTSLVIVCVYAKHKVSYHNASSLHNLDLVNTYASTEHSI